MTSRAVRPIFTAAIAVLGTSIALAQPSQLGRPLKFEVAAIKPGNTNHIGSSTSIKGGTYHMVNSSLKQWVEIAFSVADYALKAPAWIDTTTFDLDAKLPSQFTDQKSPSQPLDQKAMAEVQKSMAEKQNAISEMMRNLLIERFGLKWHEELSTVSGYELVPDKKVLAQPATFLERLRGPGGWGAGPTSVKGTNMEMSKLAELLGRALGRPVVDATHLTGGFDVNVAWRPSDEEMARVKQNYGNGVDNLPDSASTAVREQLGLRLQPAKVPGKVIVIDQMSRQPTAN